MFGLNDRSQRLCYINSQWRLRRRRVIALPARYVDVRAALAKIWWIAVVKSSRVVLPNRASFSLIGSRPEQWIWQLLLTRGAHWWYSNHRQCLLIARFLKRLFGTRTW